MLFSLVTGWLVDRYSFHPVFLLFGIIPLISAGLVWTLPQTAHGTSAAQSAAPLK
jgi:ACS family hexuronate transporter-like MFS transporter